MLACKPCAKASSAWVSFFSEEPFIVLLSVALEGVGGLVGAFTRPDCTAAVVMPAVVVTLRGRCGGGPLTGWLGIGALGVGSESGLATSTKVASVAFFAWGACAGLASALAIAGFSAVGGFSSGGDTFGAGKFGFGGLAGWDSNLSWGGFSSGWTSSRRRSWAGRSGPAEAGVSL